jgi:hypothetical protein
MPLEVEVQMWRWRERSGGRGERERCRVGGSVVEVEFWRREIFLMV